jgi:hypothetical protein
MNKKTREWKEACVDYVIGHANFEGGTGTNNGRSRV